MRHTGLCWICFLVGLLPLTQVGAQTKSESSASIDFSRQIRPILSDNCFRCHGPDANERKAKMRLDSREG
ncbi:MAG: hypothetical protein HY040_10770, partial [Planctomycetes bacterium]|nr:hypothetical protein [Planctomycetota bacterium]